MDLNSVGHTERHGSGEPEILAKKNDFDARLSKKERHVVLNAHNHYRRTLAKGESRSNDGDTLPEAANMFKMKYSRKIEHVAQKWASKCTGKHSYNPKYGENIAQFWPYANKKKVLKESAHNWWAELKKFGMNRNLKFTETLDNGNTWEDIGHWSQVYSYIFYSTELAARETCLSCCMFTILWRWREPSGLSPSPHLRISIKWYIHIFLLDEIDSSRDMSTHLNSDITDVPPQTNVDRRCQHRRCQQEARPQTHRISEPLLEPTQMERTLR
ncbi:cysteine-rich secretory protein family domain-containing protein [Ditylenchus destructor]|uniref:Cysteine-rich secretory protein family domain-containing protein n=1 Tax=Ditylenchus destructor TaxID=166010 RepID=A0AAD4ML74_9BILA|nr:cysteine-rich secretory protein family domain-containing protein [Ditylenchus destructor]